MLDGQTHAAERLSTKLHNYDLQKGKSDRMNSALEPKHAESNGNLLHTTTITTYSTTILGKVCDSGRTLCFYPRYSLTQVCVMYLSLHRGLWVRLTRKAVVCILELLAYCISYTTYFEILNIFLA